MVVKATSHIRLKAHDHCIFKSLIGKKRPRLSKPLPLKGEGLRTQWNYHGCIFYMINITNLPLHGVWHLLHVVSTLVEVFDELWGLLNFVLCLALGGSFDTNPSKPWNITCLNQGLRQPLVRVKDPHNYVVMGLRLVCEVAIIPNNSDETYSISTKVQSWKWCRMDKMQIKL